MEDYVCQDVLGLIIKQLPFDLKNLSLTCKYFYNTALLVKRIYNEGNYILSKIQQNMITDMTTHVDEIKNNDKKIPLIIQAQLSVGKTAAVLAFAVSKYIGTVVIMVPKAIMIQWHNEIIKMYGQDGFETKKIKIISEDYCKGKFIDKCRGNKFNPASVDCKVIIVSTGIQTDPSEITKHSLIIIDEVHKMYNYIAYPKVIGVTA